MTIRSSTENQDQHQVLLSHIYVIRIIGY